MDHHPYRIVEAQFDDREQVVMLVNEAYWHQQKPFFHDIPESHHRLSLSEFDRLMRETNQKIFLLKNNNRILGVIVVEIPPDEEWVKFGLFAIDKEFFGKKLGRLLIGYVENDAFEKGKKMIKIEVFTFATKLANYYLQLGYSFTGKTAPFFHDKCIKSEYQSQDKQYLKEMIKNLSKIRTR